MQISSGDSTAAYDTDRNRRAWPWRLNLIIALISAVIISLALLMLNGAGQVSIALEDLETGTLERAILTPELIVNGTVVSDTTVAVSALEGGTVETLYARNGEEVLAGEPVIRLSNPTLERQVSDEAVRLTRDLVSIESQITEMERQITDAERLVRDVRFQLRQAEAELARNQVLEERGFASPAQMDRLRDEVAYYASEEQAALARLETAQNTAQSRIVRLNRIRQDLELLSVSSRQRLENLVLRAPVDGQVAGLQRRVGETIPSSTEVFRISRGTADQISARVFESLAQEVQPGATAKLLDYQAALRVEFIEPEAVEGSVGMRLVFLDPPPPTLRSGQVVQMAIAAGAPREALIAPYGELVGPEHLWVVNEAGTRARAVPARLGQRSSDSLEVLSDLEPGTTILLSSPRPLDNLSEVRLRGNN